MMSDSPISNTGFCNQSRMLCNSLSNSSSKYSWDVSYLGTSNMDCRTLTKMIAFGKIHNGCIDRFALYNGIYNNFRFFPPLGTKPYCEDILQDVINEVKPDVFGVLLDTFMTQFLINMDLSGMATTFWFPSDGEPLPLYCENVLKKIQHPVAMSKFAQRQAQEQYGIKTYYIPHGVNTNTFYPMENKDELRRKWTIRLGFGLQNKFILGFVGRFQGRKMVPELIQAFYKFQKGKDDVVLLLHSDPNDIAGQQLGHNINALIDKLNIRHKVVFTGTRAVFGMSENEMREIYNLMDLQVSATSGEGFGIPIIEGEACGVPMLVTDFTTSKELVADGNCGELVKVATRILGTYNVERAMIDIDDMANKMSKFYNNRTALAGYAKNCRDWAVSQYDWDKVVFPKWLKYLEKMV